MPGLLRHGLTLLRAPGVELGFALRSALRLRRGPVALPDEPKRGLFAAAGPANGSRLQANADALLRTYDLAHLAAASTRTLFRSNLARLDGLDRLAGSRRIPCRDGLVRALDIGSGDFHYAPALQRWLARHGGGERRVDLTGVELDGHGLYRDGRARVDHAEAWARLASSPAARVRYVVADATGGSEGDGDLDVVTLFFPFVGAYASLRWGTPLSRLRPRRLLQRAAGLLRPGGWLVVVNQTVLEHRRCARWLAAAPVERVVRRRFGSELAPDAERCAGQIGAILVRHDGVPDDASCG